MTTRRNTKRAAYPNPRTTEQYARGGTTKTIASLDEQSTLAMQWARRAISERQRLTPSTGVVIRRALVAYAELLAELVRAELGAAGAEGSSAELRWRCELRHLGECARGRQVDAEAWNRTADALEADQPVPPLGHLLRPPRDVVEVLASEARLEALLAAVGPRRRAPPKSRPTTRCKPHPNVPSKPAPEPAAAQHSAPPSASWVRAPALPPQDDYTDMDRIIDMQDLPRR